MNLISELSIESLPCMKPTLTPGIRDSMQYP